MGETLCARCQMQTEKTDANGMCWACTPNAALTELQFGQPTALESDEPSHYQCEASMDGGDGPARCRLRAGHASHHVAFNLNDGPYQSPGEQRQERERSLERIVNEAGRPLMKVSVPGIPPAVKVALRIIEALKDKPLEVLDATDVWDRSIAVVCRYYDYVHQQDHALNTVRETTSRFRETYKPGQAEIDREAFLRP